MTATKGQPRREQWPTADFLQEAMRNQLSAHLAVTAVEGEAFLLSVETPFVLPSGALFRLYVSTANPGGLVMTDRGQTALDTLRDGGAADLLERMAPAYAQHHGCGWFPPGELRCVGFFSEDLARRLPFMAAAAAQIYVAAGATSCERDE